MTATDVLEVLEEITTSVVEPNAPDVDATGAFPREAIEALGSAGLLGLTSATDVGGMGLGIAEAAKVVRRLGAGCASTAMVTCMHYSATAMIEAHGPTDVRRAIARGRHLTTLAFSEAGSRSHFWA
ncbi:MAG TPA: acyl-CoA dehydrogenase family protein, partial [Acidimicrobiales bacterium]